MISIIICTLNRSEFLILCLESLLNQTISCDLFEVLVVDNGSKDDTSNIAQEYSKKFPHFQYLHESKTGLSYARNTGMKYSKYNWIAYLDDDAKAHSNFVEEALYTISKNSFDCFGGTYLAWFKYGKPKWLPENFGTKPLLRDDIGEISNGYLSGGVIFFKKEVLEILGGFPTHVGMKGNKIAYGEETILQVKMKEQGFKLGYNPGIKIDHLVAKYKLKLAWHIKSSYAKGRDSMFIWNRKNDNNFLNLSITIIKIFYFYTYSSLKKICTQKDYYIQNLILDIFSPIAFELGKYNAYSKYTN